MKQCLDFVYFDFYVLSILYLMRALVVVYIYVGLAFRTCSLYPRYQYLRGNSCRMLCKIERGTFFAYFEEAIA